MYNSEIEKVVVTRAGCRRKRLHGKRPHGKKIEGSHLQELQKLTKNSERNNKINLMFSQS